jgi:hypothetical protein
MTTYLIPEKLIEQLTMCNTSPSHKWLYTNSKQTCGKAEVELHANSPEDCRHMGLGGEHGDGYYILAYTVDLSQDPVWGGKCQLFKRCCAWPDMASEIVLFGSLPEEEYWARKERTFYYDAVAGPNAYDEIQGYYNTNTAPGSTWYIHHG